MELTEELKNEFLKDIAKFAVSTGHRVTASVTEYKDGDRCMSVTVFEPEEVNRMDDLISRQAAIDAMTECYRSIMGDEPPKLDEKTALYVDLKQAVKRLPTAEKRGEWIPVVDGNYILWECSECHVESDNWTDYCPNCGARMEESEILHRGEGS